MQALATNTTVKLSVAHNISSMKIIQARFDLHQTILSIKENIENRYGSLVPYIKLQLRDLKGNLLSELDDDLKILGFYGAKDNMQLYVIDLNPSSIHKEIQSYQGVEKYVISQEDYNNLPQNFRKWKKQLLLKNPDLLKVNSNEKQYVDPEQYTELAASIPLHARCKLSSGPRGSIQYVGKIMDLGVGYFVGVKLDEPYGDSNGCIKGVKYFDAAAKYATFVRPSDLQVGDFPVLDIDDQI